MGESLMLRRSASFQTGIERVGGFADCIHSFRRVVELKRIPDNKLPLIATPSALRFPLSRPS
jgi:hypothetical protein